MAAVGTMEKHSQNANDLEHKDSKIDELHRVGITIFVLRDFFIFLGGGVGGGLLSF
jgi:hypothetical protein